MIYYTDMEKFLKNTIIGGLFILPFLPLFVANSLYFPFIAGKGFALRIIVEIIFSAWLVLALLDKQYRPKKSWLLLSVMAFTIIVFFADIFGVYPYKSFWSNLERMEGFFAIFHFLLYFIVIGSVFRVHNLWIKFWNTWLAGGVILSVYAFSQLAGRIPIHQGGVRVDGTFGNATYFAVYLLFNIFLALLLSVKNNNKSYKRGYYVFIIAELALLYFTATRGAILGLIGGALVMALYLSIFEREDKRVRKYAISALVGVFILVGGFLALKDTNFVRSNQTLARFASISLEETTTKSRFLIWGMAIEGFKERPILGWGQENFNYVFNKYYNPKLLGQEQWFDRTHNIVFDWLIAGGILGLLSYLSIFLSALYLLLRSHLPRTEKAVLLGLLSGYFFQNLFVFDNNISYLLFFSVLSYIYVETREGDGEIIARDFDASMVRYIALPVVGVLLLFALYVVNVKPIIAGQTLIKALSATDVNVIKENFGKVFAYGTFVTPEGREQLVQMTKNINKATNVTTEVKNHFLNFSKDELDKELLFRPTDARYLVFAGSLLHEFGQYEPAVTYFERALQASPKKQPIMFGLASSYLELDDTETALSYFKQAYDLDPSFAQPRNLYLLGLVYNKNFDEADALIEKHGTDIIDQRIAAAYFQTGATQKGLQLMLSLVERSPNDADLYVSLAAMYSEAGRDAEAIKALQKAIELNPGFKEQGEFYIEQIRTGQI